MGYSRNFEFVKPCDIWCE